GRLIGFDIDPAAVAAAQTDLRDAFAEHLGVEISPDCLNIHPVDIFQCSPLPRLLRALEIPRLHSDERLIVIGNPPYVEAKRLPRQGKETLRERFPEAVAGAPDLYLYFLHVCLHWLRPVDTLAFVLPNKLLVNTNARRVREQLLNEQRLRGLWFATQAAFFPEAAVYPMVLFA